MFHGFESSEYKHSKIYWFIRIADIKGDPVVVCIDEQNDFLEVLQPCRGHLYLNTRLILVGVMSIPCRSVVILMQRLYIHFHRSTRLHAYNFTMEYFFHRVNICRVVTLEMEMKMWASSRCGIGFYATFKFHANRLRNDRVVPFGNCAIWVDAKESPLLLDHTSIPFLQVRPLNGCLHVRGK